MLSTPHKGLHAHHSTSPCTPLPIITHSTQPASRRERTLADVGNRHRDSLIRRAVLGRVLLLASLLVATLARRLVGAGLARNVAVDVAVGVVVDVGVRADGASSDELPDNVNGDALRAAGAGPVIVIRRILEPRNSTRVGALALRIRIGVPNRQVGVARGINTSVRVLERKGDVEGVAVADDLQVGDRSRAKLVRLGRLRSGLALAILPLEEVESVARVVSQVPERA
ncbi:hypothetical protein BC567DRAFT_235947 [Phyllosticta citribraziliensis]